jgi:hypothetical protein
VENVEGGLFVEDLAVENPIFMSSGGANVRKRRIDDRR